MPSSESEGRERFGDRLLWSVVAASGVITILTVIGTRFIAPPPRPQVPRGGLALPRMRPPPQSAGELLRALGIGSLTWYVCILSAPLGVELGRPPARRRAARARDGRRAASAELRGRPAGAAAAGVPSGLSGD